MSAARFAARYIDGYKLAIIPLPPHSKVPTLTDWPNRFFPTSQAAFVYFTQNPDHNMGCVLGPSRLCSLDIDDLENTRIVMSEWGIDVDALALKVPTICGKPGRMRLEFRVPSGMELSRHSLTWPTREDPAKQAVLFELRAGAVQDVLPPSIHPDTMAPYEWVTSPIDGVFPELPEAFWPLWTHWDVFKPQAQALCHWAPRVEPVAARARVEASGDSPIAAWNAQADICATLELYGYTRCGRRYLSPHSTTKLAGVNLTGDGRCFIHHASDPLCTDESGHPVNAFDLFCHYEHAGVVTDAVRAAAVALGMNSKPIPLKRSQKPALGVVDADGSVRVPAPSADEEELPTGFSQDALASAFTAQHSEWRYVSEWDKWFCWDGQKWAKDTILTVFNLSRAICRAQAVEAAKYGATAGAMRTIQSANTIAAVERIARADPTHASRTDQWDADPWLLNTPNGIIDLTDGSLRPGTPDEHMTKITRVGPGGDCPEWRKFLNVATNGDQDLMDFIQRMAGYCLTGITREHALFFVYGKGGNGKGTFLNMLTWILNDYAQVASMETFTEARGERHPTELAGLMGARFVPAQETEEGRRWAEARIKALTGGDPIRARFMRQDEFTFQPQFKLVVIGNHKPGLRNVDDAIRRRLHMIPFTRKITDAEKDMLLPDKLQAEASGILQWAVAGCMEWQRVGLAPPECVRALTEDYLTSQDSLATWIEECCEISPPWSCKLSVLYTSYKGWAESNNEPTLGRRRFSEAIESRGYSTVRRGGNYMTHGINLKPDEEAVKRGNLYAD